MLISNIILEKLIRSNDKLSGALLKVKDFFLSCMDPREINNAYDKLISYIYIYIYIYIYMYYKIYIYLYMYYNNNENYNLLYFINYKFLIHDPFFFFSFILHNIYLFINIYFLKYNA